MSLDTIVIIIGAIMAIFSALGAYFSGLNHKILNSGSTIQVTHASIVQPQTNAIPAMQATVTKSITVDGITYVQKI